MSLNLTPFSFLYLSIYSCLLLVLFSISDFLSFWIVIELAMLVFIGVGYSFLSSSFSSLMQYFLVQAVSSFSLLIFYLLPWSFLFTSALLLKLAIFPFFSWYLAVLYNFPNLLLFLASSFHKLPPLLLLSLSGELISFGMLEISFLLTFFATSVIMLITSDLRFLLVVSSVSNNSWLILSSLVSQGFMLLFLCVYSMTLYAVLSSFGSSAIPLTSFFLVVGIIALSGLPPFPLFFLNSFLVLSVFSGFPVILLFLALAALALCAYVQSTFSLLVFSFSSLVKQLT